MAAMPILLVTVALSASGEAVLLDFYSDTCPPCRRMDPVVKQLAARGYPIRQVNVGQEPALASRFRVRMVPCFVMVVNGKEVDREVGETSPQRLEQMLARAPRQSPAPERTIHLVSGPGGGSVPIPARRSEPAFGEAAPQATAVPRERPQSAAVPGWRLVSPDWAPAAEPPAVAEDVLRATTVRIRVAKGMGWSCGSGTIIDVRGKEALVLTCGHLFRDSQGQGRIEVDGFGPNPYSQIPGTLVHYDLDRDVALISINSPGPVTAAKVAPPGYKIAKGTRVFSVGCDGGAPPTVQKGVVTTLDRFLAPPNLTATGLPVEGRSGGGLFTAEGLVIGVCNAALKEENEGYYAALPSIHAELDCARLGFVYRPEAEPRGAAGPEVAANPPTMPRRMPAPSDLKQPTDFSQPDSMAPPARPDRAPPSAPQTGRLRGDEQATWEEIQRRRAEGAEVVLVIRPPNNQDRSEVIVLEKPSEAFLKRLNDEANRGGHPTALPGPSGPATGGPPGEMTKVRSPASPPADLPDAPEWKPRWLQPGYRGQ